MSTTIDEYREAKENYSRLRNQAKKELIARFHQLANELLQLQQEILEDFGEKVTIPPRGKKKRVAVKASSTGPAASSPKITALQQQIETQKKKLAQAQAAGKATKAVEDRIYELEDEIRLADAQRA